MTMFHLFIYDLAHYVTLQIHITTDFQTNSFGSLNTSVHDSNTFDKTHPTQFQLIY